MSSRGPRSAGWSITVATLVLYASTALAQQPTGTITGTVSDKLGGVIAGARVTVVSDANQSSYVVRTERDGVFTVFGRLFG